MNKKIICLLVGLALAGCKEKATPAEPTAASAKATAEATAKPATGPVQTGTGNKDVKETVAQLPAVDESLQAAREAGLLEAWQKVAPFKTRKLDGMMPGEMSIEVGKILVDVAVCVADKKKKITQEVVDQLTLATKAFSPPPETQKQIDALTEDVKKGAKDEDLRDKLNKLVVSTLPAIEEDPKLANSAGLAMVGGYLRSLAVTSKVLSSGDAADQDKLDLLSRKQENAFFIDMLSTKIDSSIKGEQAIKDALDALQKIKPNVSKPKPSVDDAKAIAAALVKYAS